MTNFNSNNFVKMTKRSTKGDDFDSGRGRKLNKVRRDRSHKRNWEGQ